MRTVSISMENLFKKLGYNLSDMPLNEIIYVGDRNIYLKAFSKGKIVKKKLKGIIKKTPTEEYRVSLNGKLLFSGSPNHRIWSNGKWLKLKDIKPETEIVDSVGDSIKIRVDLMRHTIPIVDVVMDGGNYFSNGILSHNSGGNALKFYSSVRIELARTKNNKSGEKLTSTQHKVTIRKNKVGTPMSTLSVKIGDKGWIL